MTLALVLCVAACLVVNVALGAIGIHPWVVIGVLGEHLGIGVGGAATLQEDAVVWQIRMPRALLAMLVGTGLAVNAVGGAAVGFLTFAADEDQLQDIVFWMLGSLGGATWETVRVALPFVAVGLVGIPLLARSLNALTLGGREAAHLGVATERTRIAVIVLCALAAGGAVAAAGVISFVGLIVPHLVRLAAGPDHRVVLPASALGGAVLVLLADLGARTLAVPQELPLGVLTGLLGGPFFLWLLRRTREEHGGW